MFSPKIHDNSNECQHDILFTLARLNQSTKYMFKVATEMQSNLKNKPPERCQRCYGVYLFIKQKLSRNFCCNRKYPHLVRTSYFYRNLEEKKYSNCVRVYFSCFTKVCSIQNTQSSKTISVYCWFFCTPQRGGSAFLSWHLSFFVCIADCQYELLIGIETRYR